MYCVLWDVVALLLCLCVLLVPVLKKVVVCFVCDLLCDTH